ncbi:MAG: F0F1 ATP synthase subunit B' [Cyanobacteria bacterium J06641_5]
MTIASIVLLATEAKEGGGLFDFDLTLPLMAVQFLILMVVLDKLFYSPIGKAMDDRATYLREQLAQSKDGSAETVELTAKLDDSLREARRDAAATIAKAQAEAQAVATEAATKAQQEVQAQREQAAAEIGAQKTAALSSLEQQVGTLSQQILNKLLGAELAR